MIIQRGLIQTIRPFLERDEFLSIIGPRQSGKTTFLDIIKEYLINDLGVDRGLIQTITFEDRRLLMEFDKDPVSFITSYMPEDRSKKCYLMIDEFQYAVEGGQKLKLIYDTVKNIKIIITGSSSLDIKARVGKYMVGRMLNFYLYPFNFKEYLSAHNNRLERIYSEHNEKVVRWLLKGEYFKIERGEEPFSEEFIKEYERYCIWGGYPSVVLAKSELEKRKLLADIYNNYILKDVKTLLELATEKNLFLLSQYLATQIGGIVVYNNLSQVSGLDYRKLKNHLVILEETFVCREIRPFFSNRQKELSKNPKVYFIDLGFRNHLMENMNGFEKRSDAGAVIENACFIRLNELCIGVNKINFWRTKAGAEVDFVLHVGSSVLPIEVKYSPFTEERLSKSLTSFIDYFKPKDVLVLTKNYWGFAERSRTKVLFVPVYFL